MKSKIILKIKNRNDNYRTQNEIKIETKIISK